MCQRDLALLLALRLQATWAEEVWCAHSSRLVPGTSSINYGGEASPEPPPGPNIVIRRTCSRRYHCACKTQSAIRRVQSPSLTHRRPRSCMANLGFAR
jgi:hypothetical protein